MYRSLLVSITLLFLCANTYSQSLKKESFLRPQPITQSKWKPYTGSMSIASSVICFGGAIADPISTRGLNETNPLFRNDRGGVRMGRSLAIGAAVCGGTYLFEKKNPQLASLIRFVFGGVKIGFAIRNARLK